MALGGNKIIQKNKRKHHSTMGVTMMDLTLNRVTREGHPRFWERPRLKLLRATRHDKLPQSFVQRSKLRDREKSSLSAIVRSDLPQAAS